MNFISLYPRLNDNLIKGIEYNNNEYFQFYYQDDDNFEREISIDNKNEQHILMVDKYDRWFYNTNNLIIKKNIRFKTKNLFGENGIAPMNSKIGLAFIVESNDTKFKKVEKIKEFDYSDMMVNYQFIKEFPKNTFQGNTTIKFVLYLAKKSNLILDNEKNKVNMEGAIFGVLEEKTLIFEGSASTFPTVEFEDSTKPLWTLNILENIEMPISEAITLNINKAHHDYDLFNSQDERHNPEFIKEVSIMIIVKILWKLKEDYSTILENKYESGTLGSLASYYIRVYNPSFESLEKLYESISFEVRKRWVSWEWLRPMPKNTMRN